MPSAPSKEEEEEEEEEIRSDPTPPLRVSEIVLYHSDPYEKYSFAFCFPPFLVAKMFVSETKWVQNGVGR